MRRSAVALVGVCVLVGGSAAVMSSADAVPLGPRVQVDGAVSAPVTYTQLSLSSLPQVTLPDTRPGGGTSVRGISLDDIVTRSRPRLPDEKNPQLTVTVTVTGADRSVTVALGELDAGFGNHPAVLVPGGSGKKGPQLAIPGDSTGKRTVNDVREIRVDIASPATVTGLPAGTVQVTDGTNSTLLSAAQLAALPATQTTVTFTAGTATQQHTENGPTLAAVLRAAGVAKSPTTAVAAVGSDGYVAVVTPAEAVSGRRPLLLSTVEDGVALTQPRLIAAGDVKGGRDVSGVVTLAAFTADDSRSAPA